ncbi:MAG: alpha/beta hydrolase [Candidatus Thorarchaeota archaeon]|nr:alpha/beta hydrolase [Candidatus Thorarchaeota archaeon]
MVLVGSGVGGWVFKDPFTRQLLDKAEAALEDKNPDLAMQLFLTIWLAGPNRSWDDLDPKLRRLAIDMAPRIDVDPIGREMPLEPVALHRLEEVKAPTLVIIGDGDTLELIEISNILSAKISNAKKVAMAGVAHYPNVENSAEFNEIVLEFLNALP